MVQRSSYWSAKGAADNPPAIKQILDRIFEGKGTVRGTQGVEIDAELEEKAQWLSTGHFCLNYAGREEDANALAMTSGNAIEKFLIRFKSKTLNATDWIYKWLNFKQDLVNP